MNPKIHTPEVDELFDAILTLENKEECYRLFEDMCTIKELLAIAQRYQVARRLTQGHTYLDICNETGASTATISRVNRSLVYGEDGYQTVFAHLGLETAPVRK